MLGNAFLGTVVATALGLPAVLGAEAIYVLLDAPGGSSAIRGEDPLRRGSDPLYGRQLDPLQLTSESESYSTFAEAWVVAQESGRVVAEVDSSDLPARVATRKVDGPFTLDQFGENPGSKRELPAFQSAVPFDSALLGRDRASLSADELIAVGFDAPRNPDGVPALEDFLQRHPSHPKRQLANLRLARRLMGRKDFDGVRAALSEVSSEGSDSEKAMAKILTAYARLYEGPYEDAYTAFCEVACDPTLSDDIRTDAMQRAAGAAYADRNLVEAFRSYSQLQDAPVSATLRAEAAKELAGVAFEIKAIKGEGDWEEVRAYCQRAAAMEGASRSVRATSELMYLETYFNENRLEECLGLAETFAGEYSDVRREWMLARVWKGVCLAKLGRFSEADQSLAPLLSEPLADDEKFGGQEPLAKAAYWLAWTAMQQGDTAARDRYLTYLETNYPESSEHEQSAWIRAAVVPSASRN